MALYKIQDFNHNYREEAFDGGDVKGLDVYSGGTNEKIGNIYDVLVDETGRFRYLVIDTGFWIFGKKVLLPIGQCRVDVEGERVYATGLTNKRQAEELPEYDESMTIDHGYEERVRDVYRPKVVEASTPVEQSAAVEASLPVEEDEALRRARVQRPVPAPTPAPAPVRENYTYEREPSLYQMNESEHQRLKLYEEKLVASKSRRKAGDVAIGKRVETETARVAVPVEKERVVIERRTPTDAGNIVTPGATDFRSGEVARMEVYEETADVSKQAVLREEVQVRKEVERETVEATETVRREELDLDIEGNPMINRSPQRPENPNR